MRRYAHFLALRRSMTHATALSFDAGAVGPTRRRPMAGFRRRHYARDTNGVTRAHRAAESHDYMHSFQAFALP